MPTRDANVALPNAVASGKVKRGMCAVCSDSPTDAHHVDYDRPLDVVWLCKKHHVEEHQRLKNEGVIIPGSRGSYVVHVKVPEVDYKQLAKISKQDRRSMNFLVNEAIQKFLAGHRKACNGR